MVYVSLLQSIVVHLPSHCEVQGQRGTRCLLLLNQLSFKLLLCVCVTTNRLNVRRQRSQRNTESQIEINIILCVVYPCISAD